MNKDRGMIKWMPFNSVVSNKEILYSLIKEKEKITNCTFFCLDAKDETNEFEKTIIDAYYMQDKIHITYYKKGYTYEYYGLIKKIDSSNKLIYLNNFKILFNQILGVTDTK